MNSKIQTKQVADMSVQPANDRQPYLPPRIEVFPVEQLSMICTSVKIGQGSTEDDYEDKGDHEGDDFEVDLGF